jgi:hypothetical protein
MWSNLQYFQRQQLIYGNHTNQPLLSKFCLLALLVDFHFNFNDKIMRKMQWLIVFTYFLTYTCAGRVETILRSFQASKISSFLVPHNRLSALSGPTQIKTGMTYYTSRHTMSMKMVSDSKKLFKGFTPLLLRVIPTRAVYFCAYTATKEKLRPMLGDSNMNHRVSSFAAGIFSETVKLTLYQNILLQFTFIAQIKSPNWISKARYHLPINPTVCERVYKSCFDVVRRAVQEEGRNMLFKGLGAATADYIRTTTTHRFPRSNIKATINIGREKSGSFLRTLKSKFTRMGGETTANSVKKKVAQQQTARLHNLHHAMRTEINNNAHTSAPSLLDSSSSSSPSSPAVHAVCEVASGRNLNVVRSGLANRMLCSLVTDER